MPMVPTTDYLNTIAPENEPEFPGDEDIERRYRWAHNRWGPHGRPRMRVDFDRFIDVIRQIDDFFVTVVKLPPM